MHPLKGLVPNPVSQYDSSKCYVAIDYSLFFNKFQRNVQGAARLGLFKHISRAWPPYIRLGSGSYRIYL